MWSLGEFGTAWIETVPKHGYLTLCAASAALAVLLARQPAALDSPPVRFDVPLSATMRLEFLDGRRYRRTADCSCTPWRMGGAGSFAPTWNHRRPSSLGNRHPGALGNQSGSICRRDHDTATDWLNANRKADPAIVG